MLTDRYGLGLSTVSTAAQDAYVQATDLALTFYPGAAETYYRPSPPILISRWPIPVRLRC
jgi:hypothetical protein